MLIRNCPAHFRLFIFSPFFFFSVSERSVGQSLSTSVSLTSGGAFKADFFFLSQSGPGLLLFQWRVPLFLVEPTDQHSNRTQRLTSDRMEE